MRRTVLGAIFVAYLLLAAFLVWNPTPAVGSTSVEVVSRLLAQVGLPNSSTIVEFVLNVALFVPISLLGVLIVPRMTVSGWATVSFVASSGVELIQRLVLPERTSSTNDVVANTAGALLGALLAWVLWPWLAPGQDRPALAATPRADLTGGDPS